MLGGDNGGEEFSFSGTGGSDGLCLGSVRNNTTTKHETVTGSRASVAKIIRMSSINKTLELQRIRRLRKGR